MEKSTSDQHCREWSVRLYGTRLCGSNTVYMDHSPQCWSEVFLNLSKCFNIVSFFLKFIFHKVV